MKRYLQMILNILTSVYMLLIIVVMPFYFEEGYSHIGTDKSYFFRTCTKYTAAVLLPVLIAYWICIVAEWSQKIHAEQTGLSAVGFRKIVTARKKKWSVTDTFALGYFVSVCLSYFFSDYKATALWGEPGWYMGMIPQLMFVGVYFAVSGLWKGSDRMAYLFLPVSAAVFVLGYLNRFDIWPIPMENAGMPSFISTIGNINWYCGYMVSVMFLGIGMFWMDKGEKKRRTVLLVLYCFAAFGTAVTQGSDSGIFALAAVLFFLFVMSARRLPEDAMLLQRFWQLILIFSAACGVTWGIRVLFPERINQTSGVTDLLTDSLFFGVLGIVAIGELWLLYLQEKNPKLRERNTKGYFYFTRTICVLVPMTVIFMIGMLVLNTLHPGCLGALSDNRFFVFDADWGSGRGATWSAGWQCFSDQNALHKLVGVGPDCMAEYIYSGMDEKLTKSIQQTFVGARLTNAHCELLTVLVCNGLLGVVCFAGMMGSACVRFLRGTKETATRRSIAVACGLCVLAYLCNNIWSFQQSMSAATIFTVLGVGVKVNRRSGKPSDLT